MIVYVYVHNDVYVFACRCTSILDYISRLVLVECHIRLPGFTKDDGS